jgi:hypothetical protein
VPKAKIYNNSIEHALRGVVMGRCNWLRLGGEVRGERALACGKPFNYPQVPDVKNPENFEKIIYNRFNFLWI